MHKDDQNFGASPDRIFEGQTCNKCVAIKTGKEIPLSDSGLCLLEVKTRVEGCAEPLTSLTAAHIAQVQIQEACTSADICILQSFVPESKKSRYFLIRRNESFIDSFLCCCNAILANKQVENVCQDIEQLLFCPEIAGRFVNTGAYI